MGPILSHTYSLWICGTGSSTSLSARVRERRHSLKMTQAHLAARVGLLRSSVANIEAGRQRITVHVLYHLCEVLGMDVVTAIPARVIDEDESVQ
ncbi:helix-turn-helix transcriptional regulator [Chloroflexales bacterium ZM16-3]|nr:helix-turn-helix transcriptional regulator [Chloroflexales bacterium ZM16-3]